MKVGRCTRCGREEIQLYDIFGPVQYIGEASIFIKDFKKCEEIASVCRTCLEAIKDVIGLCDLPIT